VIQGWLGKKAWDPIKQKKNRRQPTWYSSLPMGAFSLSLNNFFNYYFMCYYILFFNKLCSLKIKKNWMCSSSNKEPSSQVEDLGFKHQYSQNQKNKKRILLLKLFYINYVFWRVMQFDCWDFSCLILPCEEYGPLKKVVSTRHWWLTPVILATWETKIKRMDSGSSPALENSFWDSISKNNQSKMRYTQVVEQRLSKC
jgi:hypothetical protein